MNKFLSTLSLSALALISVSCNGSDGDVAKVEESLRSVPFNEVTLNDDFWLPRLKIQKQTLVPFSLEKTAYAVENLRKVGAYLRGEKVDSPIEGPIYVASDLFKVMEGAAYLLTLEKDEELEKQLDEIIDVIAAAQEEDGYLYEHHIMPPHLRNQGNNGGAGPERYSWVIHSHELYNMGHMYEGAIAYWRATGKRKWLDVAEKSAMHFNRVFFEGGDPKYNGGKPIMQAPGHEELELALVKMYQATGKKLYLEMAKKFLDIRGVTYFPGGESGVMTNTYTQQHQPVRDQREAVGHAVRAAYLYSGMADVMAQTGDQTLKPALESVWHDIVDRKMHITGGLGAVAGIEGFGPAYALPNKDTYDETCAAVGNVFFNYRMFLASSEAKYVDVAEVALYNNVLAGVNLEGNKFFYVNPLQADGRKTFNHGQAGRSPWFWCACCPSNLARLIPQISGMIYSHTDDDIFCGFYAGSSVDVALAEGKVRLEQRTQYPFEGRIELDVMPENDGEEFTLWLRIPTWCTDRFVAGELYSYADGESGKSPKAKVNGMRVRAEVVDGYLPVKRSWKRGDKVVLDLPMPVRYSVADARVEADRGRLCVTRGPLVYCAEGVDNSHNPIHYFISDFGHQGEFEYAQDGVLKGIPSITIPAQAVEAESSVDASLKLIPYYAWNNRGDNGTMNVWFADNADTAREGAALTVGNIADVRATATYSGDIEYAVADGREPKDSFDTSIPRWTSWPKLGEEQVVELKLRKSQKVESLSVYWYDDKGGVQLPVEWSAQYLSGGEWHEFTPYITDSFGVEKDKYNVVHPAESIKAEALRLKIKAKSDAAVGILEAKIE